MDEALQTKLTFSSDQGIRDRLFNGWSFSLILLLLTILWLVLSGGDTWGETNIYWPLSAEVWSRQNSQHPIDPYTLTHILHGILCYWLIMLTDPKLPLNRQFFFAIALACAWELVENSTFVIERYRMVTASTDYIGDAVINSFVDILACGLGFFFARSVHLILSIGFFVAIELITLLWIKDNLFLNVLMIVLPLDEIRRWQLGV
ncbi:DUF2585 family protein [Leptolyngbya sp. 7M]|uniref:DUF2585 family protein n=1 Tax=Leptolyngbya sp. 7M TaxID=2812896 RepID=UPI001B8D2D6B|nr:DUF2585 family protein [Leptolyngbya sp. 7M]QYO66087.1 DUF2585 domain-containing protein [Leptolyngbya sp. 7M]